MSIQERIRQLQACTSPEEFTRVLCAPHIRERVCSPEEARQLLDSLYRDNKATNGAIADAIRGI